MKKAVVSIIIPTKNEIKNIPRLVASIKSQTYSAIETIVVDTGSTDSTVKLAKKLGVLVFEKGPERSAARNYGAKKAKGEFLLFLDADMELTPGVVADCVGKAKSESYKAIVIPEKTVGKGFFTQIRRFEREMYMGDPSIEVARFFEKRVFDEFGGYDLDLTGPEDYDLPLRISKKHKIGRVSEYILHHEENVSLGKLLAKKYYYASHGASYAQKHPQMLKTQGNLLFRKAYLRHWRKFFAEPVFGLSFIIVRILEAAAAILGYIKAVGVVKFLNTLWQMLRK